MVELKVRLIHWFLPCTFRVTFELNLLRQIIFYLCVWETKSWVCVEIGEELIWDTSAIAFLWEKISSYSLKQFDFRTGRAVSSVDYKVTHHPRIVHSISIKQKLVTKSDGSINTGEYPRCHLGGEYVSEKRQNALVKSRMWAVEGKTHLVPLSWHTHTCWAIHVYTRGHSTVRTPTYRLRVSSPLVCSSIEHTHWTILWTSTRACSRSNFTTKGAGLFPICGLYIHFSDSSSFVFFWNLYYIFWWAITL